MLKAIFGSKEDPEQTAISPPDVTKKIENMFDAFMAGDKSRRKKGLKKKRG